MKKVWITYCWEDNNDQEVDFIAQELRKENLDVRMDRIDIQVGKRIWNQIDHFITSPEESDAWILYATEHSLRSEPCKEEYAYALQRALKVRSENFPIIGLFSTNVIEELIPAGISSRLYVSTTDPDWKERVCSGVEGRKPNIYRENLHPFVFKIHDIGSERVAVEVRPRAGVWSPFQCVIPLNEKDSVKPNVLRGAKGSIPNACCLSSVMISEDAKQNLWSHRSNDEATPSQSYYICCNNMPSFIAFGDANSPRGLYCVKRESFLSF